MIWIIILIVVVIFFILLGVGLLLYFLVFKDKNPEVISGIVSQGVPINNDNANNATSGFFVDVPLTKGNVSENETFTNVQASSSIGTVPLTGSTGTYINSQKVRVNFDDLSIDRLLSEKLIYSKNVSGTEAFYFSAATIFTFSKLA